MVIVQQDNEEPGVGSEEEERRVEKQDGMSEREADRCEVEAGEQEGIEETQSEVQNPAPSSIARTVSNTALHKPTCFNWASEVDEAFGLSAVAHNTPHPIPIKPIPSDVTIDPIHTTLTSTVPVDHSQVVPTLTNLDHTPTTLSTPTLVEFDLTPICPAFTRAVPIDPDPGDVAPRPACVMLTNIAPTNRTPIDNAPAAPALVNPGLIIPANPDPDDPPPSSIHVSPVINCIPVDPDPICISFTSAIPTDPDPGDARTAHTTHVNSVSIDPDPVMSTSSIQLLSLL
jgi:hypothetical protein